MENKAPEIRLRADKVYYIHYGDENWGAYKFIDKVRVGEDIFLQCIALEEGFESHLTVYVPAHFIQRLIEFNSLEEYQARYDEWKEGEEERKFKSNF